MDDQRDRDHAEAIHQIADILSSAYLRLRFPHPPTAVVDCPETKSESCDE
jgi:hypothetical protein